MVRAETESEARHLAALATTKSFRLEPRVPIPINPWSAHQKITDPPTPLPSVIQDVTDQQNEFSVAGEAMVLRHGERFRFFASIDLFQRGTIYAGSRLAADSASSNLTASRSEAIWGANTTFTADTVCEFAHGVIE